jgi:hypothetical protein
MTAIPAALRERIRRRAKERCEYCRFPETLALHKHEPDHIIPVQHGGATDETNLALACLRCNRNKGPNIGSLDPETGRLVRFFDPRHQQWENHFRMENARIVPMTPEARATEKIFRFNDEDRLAERRLMIELGIQ